MTINDYKIDETTRKQGGMAVVYKGQSMSEFQPRALKMIRPDRAAINNALCNRFVKELKTIGNLTHPNIVRADRAFTYIDQQSQVPYTVLVMEWLDGLDLQEYVKRKGVIQDKQLLVKIAKSILSALSYAHQKNIIHMDVKPSNVFYTNDGQIKLIDFGIAQVIGERGEEIVGAHHYITKEKGESSFVGTDGYASPEQKFAQKVTIQSDVYSFGKTMLYLLTGDTNDSKEINDEPWKSLIAKSTQRDANKRYKNCEEIISYIDESISAGASKECINSSCKKLISINDRYCPFCGKEQTPPSPPPPPLSPSAHVFRKHCKNCGFEESGLDERQLHTHCPECNYELRNGKLEGMVWGYKAIICPNCGYTDKTRRPGEMICPKCNHTLIEGLFCRHCKKITLRGYPYCMQCGNNPLQ